MEQAEVRTMRLPVKLTTAEVALRAQEMATAESKLGEDEIRLEQFIEASKGTKNQIESDIADSRGEVRRLGRIVRDRAENREVPVVEESDYEAGAVNTRRTDTNEIVATRGMTFEERQQSLFQQQRAAKKSS